MKMHKTLHVFNLKIQNNFLRGEDSPSPLPSLFSPTRPPAFSRQLTLCVHSAKGLGNVHVFASRALNETPSQSYGMLLAILDHTVLPPTRRK